MSKEVYLTLAKGARVLVMGKLKQRSYETRDGDKRTVYEVEVDEIGPSLRFARAQVTRTGRRTDNGSGNGFGADNPTRATPTPEPATASPTPDASDPRATSVPVNGGSEVWAEPALAGVGAGVFGQSPY